MPGLALKTGGFPFARGMLKIFGAGQVSNIEA